MTALCNSGAMQGSRFEIGQTVYFQPSMGSRLLSHRLFRIVRLLPAEGMEKQYRIKSIHDSHERVAFEYELHAVTPDVLEAIDKV